MAKQQCMQRQTAPVVVYLFSIGIVDVVFFVFEATEFCLWAVLFRWHTNAFSPIHFIDSNSVSALLFQFYTLYDLLPKKL